MFVAGSDAPALMRPHVRLPPVAVGVVAVGAVALLAVRDPNEAGNYPACPVKLMTGLDCPGCGSLRAVHALAAGDLSRAASHNLMLLLAVPVAIFHYVLWARPSVAAHPRAKTWLNRWARPGVGWAVFFAVMAFALLRNLPWPPFSALHS